MTIFALVLGVVMLASTGMSIVPPPSDTTSGVSPALDTTSTVSPALDTKLQDALKEVTVGPEKEYDCLMYRLEDKILRMKERIAKIQEKLENSGTTLPGSILSGKATQAFSAHMSVDKLHMTGTLKFNNTITNVGGAFNNHTGVFTAAADGVYVFYFHADTYSTSKHCSLALLHQSNIVSQSYGYDGYGYAPLDNTAVVEMKKGDVVQVSVTHFTSTNYCYLRGKHTTFSGFELRNN